MEKPDHERLSDLEDAVFGSRSQPGLIKKTERTDERVDTLYTWRNFVMGAGLAVGALIGFFADPILRLLGFKS